MGYEKWVSSIRPCCTVAGHTAHLSPVFVEHHCSLSTTDFVFEWWKADPTDNRARLFCFRQERSMHQPLVVVNVGSKSDKAAHATKRPDVNRST